MLFRDRLAMQKKTLGSRLGLAFGGKEMVDEIMDVCVCSFLSFWLLLLYYDSMCEMC